MQTLCVPQLDVLPSYRQILGLVQIPSDKKWSSCSGTSSIMKFPNGNEEISPSDPRRLFDKNLDTRNIANKEETTTFQSTISNVSVKTDESSQKISRLHHVKQYDALFGADASSRLHDASNETDHFSSVILQTPYPGIPILSTSHIIELDEFRFVDVLHMATHLSPLELSFLVLSQSTYKQAGTSQRTTIRAQLNKDFLSHDRRYVVPVEGNIYSFLPAYDQYFLESNPFTHLIGDYNLNHFVLLVLQVLHMSRAAYSANSDPHQALAAFSNISCWKLLLLSIFSARSELLNSVLVEERINLPPNNDEMLISLKAGTFSLESSTFCNESWFRVVKFMLNRLLHPEMISTALSSKEKWMKVAEPFTYAVASCDPTDTQAALHALDCTSARKANKFDTKARAEKALKHHYFFRNYSLPFGCPPTTVKEGRTESTTQRAYDAEHLGRLSHVDLPRDARNIGKLVVTNKRGWNLSRPESTCLDIRVPGYYKGLLYIQNSRMMFEQKGVAKRVDRFWRNITGITIMSNGAQKKETPQPNEEPSSVLEVVLSGRAGPKAAQWAWRQLFFGAVRVGANRPSYLKHLAEHEDGIEVRTIIPKEVFEGLEVICGKDDRIFIPASGLESVAPDLRLNRDGPSYMTLKADSLTDFEGATRGSLLISMNLG